jgi:hypothetical protein
MHLPAPTPDKVTPAQNPIQKPDGPPSAAESPETGPRGKKPPVFPEVVVPEVAQAHQSTPSWLLTFKLLERLAKGLTWVGSILLLTGLACSWRIFLRPENLTLLCLNLLLLAITRIRYWTAGLDLRYFMPMVIIGVPWIALGLDNVLAGARWLFQRPKARSPRALKLLTGSLIAVAVTCSFLDGPLSAAAYMRKHAALGRWIASRLGPKTSIAGNFDNLSLEAYYSNGQVIEIVWPRDCLLPQMPESIAAQKADVIALWNDEGIARQHLETIEARLTSSCGYRRVDERDLPAGKNELMVFVRDG